MSNWNVWKNNYKKVISSSHDHQVLSSSYDYFFHKIKIQSGKILSTIYASTSSNYLLTGYWWSYKESSNIEASYEANNAFIFVNSKKDEKLVINSAEWKKADDFFNLRLLAVQSWCHAIWNWLLLTFIASQFFFCKLFLFQFFFWKEKK